jgi:hypothetical protein
MKAFTTLLAASIGRSSSSISSSGKVAVSLQALEATLTKVLRAQGHDAEATKIIADTLLFAELRHNNQGIVKLLAGALHPNPKARPISTVFESPVSCKLDGGQQIGMVVVRRATDIAVQKAKTCGVAVVGCSNYASATGALGVWARDIANHGLVGIVMSQCPEMVAPHGSYEPIFGTNPLAIGIPTAGRPQVCHALTSSLVLGPSLSSLLPLIRSLPPHPAEGSRHGHEVRGCLLLTSPFLLFCDHPRTLCISARPLGTAW